MLWRRKWQPTPVLLPGKSHEQRSLVGYSPWGCKEPDTTEQLHFHFLYITTATVQQAHQLKIEKKNQFMGSQKCGATGLGLLLVVVQSLSRVLTHYHVYKC